MQHCSKIQKKTTPARTSVEKVSPMEKALKQPKKLPTETIQVSSDVKILNSIQTTPSQNFFAEQHQRFSRFVQSIFLSHNS